ncbi:hypothetical protein CSW50_10050 [Thermus scotoductus]|uniref:Uncharacterized protein n=1 Tax=Thermus scotoductus TaxID=37636 RepID=A0A430UM83_THESC|nr:hypothetical protein [Thermus scotoductus]RTH00923.1 hypothetical protein CSW50_10050 [Thermus scotoductus]RTI05570.1 hypothetical protein CSW30_11220 [Thermus scotoductus]
MTLIYGSPNQSISLRVRGEANLTLERAATLEGNQVLGDGLNFPTTLRLSCVYAPTNAIPALGLEETMAHLIALGAAIRQAVRLEVSIDGATYTRALRPGGTLRVRRLQAGVAEYELELLPGEPWWRGPGNTPVLLYVG